MEGMVSDEAVEDLAKELIVKPKKCRPGHALGI
jgi:hypothetical protein